MEDAMVDHQMVNNDNIMVEEMEHLSSKELMLKFGTVWNYLVRMMMLILMKNIFMPMALMMMMITCT